MRRQITAIAILFMLLVVFLVGAVTPRGGNIAPVYYVVASDAPARFKQRLRNTRICSGTNDEIQIQAAIDQANTNGGGIVRLSQGTFTVSQRTGAVWTAYASSGDAEQIDANTLRLDNFGAWSTGAITDVAVGHMVRVYDGLHSGTNSIQDDDDQLIATVEAVNSPTSFDLTIKCIPSRDYIGAEFARIVPCITLSQFASIIGQGRQTTTRIILANDQDCAVIATAEVTAATYYGSRIANLQIHGNKSGQSSPTQDEDSSSVLLHGIVVGNLDRDIVFENIAVLNCDADGIYAIGTENLVFRQTRVNFCDENGMTLGLGDPTLVSNSLFYGNDQAGVKLRRANLVQFSNCYFRSDEDYAVRMSGSTDNQFAGCQFYTWSADGTPEGGLLLATANNIVSGCTFYTTVADAEGIELDGRHNTIVGNHFHRAYTDLGNTVPISVDLVTSHINTIYGNYGVRGSVEGVCPRYLNDSGGNIAFGEVVKYDSGSAYEIVLTTADTDKALGVAVANEDDDISGDFANGEYVYVKTSGFCNTVKFDNNANPGLGGELCCSETDSGHLKTAAANDWVVAISHGTTDGLGTPTTLDVVLIEKPYLKP